MGRSGLTNFQWQAIKLVWRRYKYFVIVAVLGIVAFTAFSTVTIMHFTVYGK